MGNSTGGSSTLSLYMVIPGSRGLLLNTRHAYIQNSFRRFSVDIQMIIFTDLVKKFARDASTTLPLWIDLVGAHGIQFISESGWGSHPTSFDVLSVFTCRASLQDSYSLFKQSTYHPNTKKIFRSVVFSSDARKKCTNTSKIFHKLANTITVPCRQSTTHFSTNT